MAIELLDINKTWAKIRAGFKDGPFFKNPVSKGSYRFVDGIEANVKSVQMRNPNPSTSAFGGKTYSERKK